jgi:hypothetical protein
MYTSEGKVGSKVGEVVRDACYLLHPFIFWHKFFHQQLVPVCSLSEFRVYMELEGLSQLTPSPENDSVIPWCGTNHV